jgi:hypothetical protein
VLLLLLLLLPLTQVGRGKSRIMPAGIKPAGGGAAAAGPAAAQAQAPAPKRSLDDLMGGGAAGGFSQVGG